MELRAPAASPILGTAESLRARSAALGRYEEWERDHRNALTPAQRIAAIGFLYELLPESRRSRPFDPSGVARMHKALAVLATTSA